MKLITLSVCTVLAVSALVAGNPAPDAKSNPGFDKLKSLTGMWKGKDGDGKEVSVSYKVVSAGTTVMETLDMMETPEAMVTMYHMAGDKLMMTHYCSMGNQPRMRADKMSADGTSMTFSMIDATGMASKKDAHMSKLVVNLKDADHFTQEWTMTQDGKTAHVGNFAFERVK